MKIGEYECLTVKKGYNEPFIKNMKEGEVYWSVKIDKDGKFDTKRQEDAIIISELIKIRRKLNKIARGK